MLGDVLVNVVLLESNGAHDVSTEDWDTQQINLVKSKIETGMAWWEETLAHYHPDAYLKFHFDFTFADQPFETAYEPIKRTSNQHELFVDEFLDAAGYTQGSISSRIRAFNHAQRMAHGADWSFTIFVVNDLNDPDDQFAPGGSFNRSFAFPGGRYVVALSDRPASIFAHEVAHMFWATDEYAGGSSYNLRRGYYDAQNLNAADGRPVGAGPQEPSLMASSSLLTQSYVNHTLPASTRAMLGWRDTDNDGILDVLDVPLELNGYGYYDASQGVYRFQGTTSVAALPNLNSEGTGNSISLNRLARVEYRIDGGAWLEGPALEGHTAELDLALPVPAGAATVEIRTVSTTSGVFSQVFHATTSQPASTTQPGINGFVWNDLNRNGQWDAGENGLAGREVILLDSQGQPITRQYALDPDPYLTGASLRNFLPQVTLTAVGNSMLSHDVVVATDPQFPDAVSVLGNPFLHEPATRWQDNTRRLQMDFSVPVSSVSVSIIAPGNGSTGRIDVFDAAGNVLATLRTDTLTVGASTTLTLSLPEAQIARAVAYGDFDTEILIDGISFGVPTTAVTDENGAFHLVVPESGDYHVAATVREYWGATAPEDSTFVLSVSAGETVTSVDFGHYLATPPWRNPANPFDVDDDGLITPLDALLIINELNAQGSRVLGEAPPAGSNFLYYDVSGDGFLAPLDALQVIIQLNAMSSVGNGEAAPPTPPAPPPPDGPAPESEPLFLVETPTAAQSPAIDAASPALGAAQNSSPHAPWGVAPPPVSSAAAFAWAHGGSARDEEASADESLDALLEALASEQAARRTF